MRTRWDKNWLAGALVAVCALAVVYLVAWPSAGQPANPASAALPTGELTAVDAAAPDAGASGGQGAETGEAAPLQPDGASDGELSGGPEYVPDTVVVELADVLTIEEVNAEVATLDFIAENSIDEADIQLGFVELHLADGVAVEDALEEMSGVEFAVSAQPNYVYHLLDDGAGPVEIPDAGNSVGTALSADMVEDRRSSGESSSLPLTAMVFQEVTAQATSINDPRAPSQWALSAVKAYEAWDSSRTEHKVTVAILDTGLDVDHPDFADANGLTNVIGGYSVLRSDHANYDDWQGHGTHVAGIVAAGANNGVGVAGVSYNASIMPVQVIDSSQNVTTTQAAAGLEYVVQYAKEHPSANVKVVNMSFGTLKEATSTGNSSGDALFQAALKKAHEAGILVVLAAGNGASSSSTSAYNCYPCDSDAEALGVINVQQSGSSYARNSSSNFNKADQRTKELSAPGTSILSTTYNGGYGTKDGTSMAAPCVAGIAALVFAANPGKTAAEVKQVLIDTATDLNAAENIQGEGQFDLQTGYGLVNAEAAVKANAAYLSGGDILVVGGSALQLTVENASGLSWTWASTNPAVATVDASGKVSAVGAGTAIISARSSGDTTLYREVKVYDPTISGSSQMEYGARATLTVPAGNPSSSWVWSSSDSSVVSIGATSGRVTARGVGNATITVKLNGNDAITKAFAITVVKADLENATLSGVEDQPYTGAAVTLPNLGVTMTDYTQYTGVRQLTDGTGSGSGDYTVSYSPSPAVEKGRVTVTVTARANSNYKGSKSGTFRIVGGGTVKNATITGTGTYTYTGKPITVDDLVVTAETGEVLVQGTDYEVVYPADHTNAGDVPLTINGINNYGGTASVYFTISPVDITSSAITVSGVTTKTYTGSAIGQSPTLRYNGMTLKAGTDYVLSYSDNTNAGTATMSIRGLGNYATYSYVLFFPQYVYRNETFTISPADISGASVSFASCTYNDSVQKSAPTVAFNGKTLTAGTDYTISYPGGDYTNAGTKSVTVDGKGNFTGTKAASYAIAKKEASIIANSKAKTYDGTALTATAAGYTTSGFVNEASDVSSVSLSGSITNVGSATARVTGYTLARGMASNYSVTTVGGTLKVSQANIALCTMTPVKSSVVYNGGGQTVAVTVKDGNTVLYQGVDYSAPTYSNNTAVGTATVTVTGEGNYTGTKSATFAITAATTQWKRLWGNTALDTMKAIVAEGGWPQGRTIVLATAGGYHDGLTANGVAGLAAAPIIMTDGSSLSPQARSLIASLRPKTIVVCGGPAAIMDSVVLQASSAAGTSPVVKRLSGQNAAETAVAIYREGASTVGGSWSTTAFVCTDDGYWDALSAAPVSYAKRMPIFLTTGAGATLPPSAISAMRSGGVKDVYIVGGEAAVKPAVVVQLRSAGITVSDRLWGQNAIETSAKVAQFGLGQGLVANNAGVATTSGYWDALAGAALCGRKDAVLVLADGPSSSTLTGFLKSNAASMVTGYVFGGTAAVSASTYDSLPC